MKRYSAPKFWKMAKKQKKFAITPNPGPHPKERCIPVGVLLRDVLGYATSKREVALILNQGSVSVDGRVVKDMHFPTGLMDVVAVGSENYRIIPGGHGLAVKKIEGSEAKSKLLQIRNKTSIKGGSVQANCHDGKNIISASGKTGDTLVFDIATKKVKDVLPFEKGSHAIIIEGHNTGVTGTIEKIIKRPGSQPNEVLLATDGQKITVPEKYVFVVGKDAPVISLGD